ncbi:MAG: potassium channel family protein [Proteobacteria bacterium]|nr:potassium channel family protein [Pseudomonadota bacterium]MBU1449771.1 potassium channel family protein [Pseudomonadota bacterium]MBU2469008.1 potassium channel family protein [Pseudomonadota bacterium]MBU2517236.1 potassium channel family protein [Pseudomonadota bacterium]
MSEGAQQVGLDTQRPWLPPSRIPLSRRLSLYFLYAVLALSLFGGHVHPSGLLIILGFVVVFQVATRPLTSDFLVRYPSYLVGLRVLLVVMCAGLAVALLPLPESWVSMEHLVVTITALVITAGWTVMVMIYLFQARQVRLDTIFSGVAAFFLLAITWTEAYKVITFFDLTAFHPPLLATGGWSDASHLRALYYSLSTITTVGFGDILPRSATAQILSGLEASAGQLFLAVLIARLVSRHLSATITPLTPPTTSPPKKINAARLSNRLRRRRRHFR